MEYKIGIVTTIKGCTNEVLNSFIDYHFAIGFDHMILFYDDVDEIPPGEVSNNENITIIKNDSHLQKLWKTTQQKEMLQFTESDLIARQVLNIEVAIKLALEMKLSWILHIDVDEIFLPSGWDNVKDHYLALDYHKIPAINYTNYEAIPEKVCIKNYYKEVTLFKRSLKHLDDKQLQLVKRKFKKNYFLFYQNGKSAGKVSKSLKASGPHSFINSFQYSAKDFPVILHYPICGFDHFYKKYSILGMFPDKWLGKHDINKLLPFHIRSRNVVNTTSYAESKKFYEQEVMIKDEQFKSEFINSGVFCRICEPSELLKLNIQK